jgi:hypothetical protein
MTRGSLTLCDGLSSVYKGADARDGTHHLYTMAVRKSAATPTPGS